MAINSNTLLIGGLIGIGALMLPSIAFANANTYDDEIKRVSEDFGVPFLIIKGIIATESGFRAGAKARTTSATGLMQITKAAAQDVGYPHEDMIYPESNISAGTLYLKRMIDKFGLFGGVRAYYSGPGNRARNSDNDPTNDRPERAAESLAYATKVFGYALAFGTDLLRV